MGDWYRVDLDKTLAHYESGDHDKHGPEYIGDPIPKAVKKVQKWLDKGRDVRLFTGRAADAEQDPAVKRAIDAWMEKNVGQKLPITDRKDHKLVKFLDDKARRVEENTGKRIK